MMMMPDRKKAVTLIISSMSGDGVSMETKEEDDYSLAFKDAGQKIISALERKDVDSFVDYMKELIFMCQEQCHEEQEPMN